MNLRELIKVEQTKVQSEKDAHAAKQQEIFDISKREMKAFIKHYEVLKEYGLTVTLCCGRSDKYETFNDYSVVVRRNGVFQFSVSPLTWYDRRREQGPGFYLCAGKLYLNGFVGFQQDYWRYADFDVVIAKYIATL